MTNTISTMLTLILLESIRMINYVGSYGIIGYMTNDLDCSVSATQAYLLLPFIAGSMIGQASLGILSDRFGQKKTMACFLNIYIIACLCCAFFNASWLFIVMRFAAGLGSTVGEITVRTIIRENFDEQSGAKLYSKTSGYSYILVGIAPLLLNRLSQHVGWKSFFIVNALFGLLVYKQTLAHNPKSQNSLTTSTWESIREQVFDTIHNSQFQNNCLKYALVVAVLESSFFLFPIILTDHFNLPEVWLSILYGVITGLVGYLSSILNTQLLRHLHTRKINQIMLKASCVLSLAYVINFNYLSGTSQFSGYLVIFYLSFLCSNILIINQFMTTSQCIEKNKVGSGLMTSLTVSVYALASLVTGYIISIVDTSNPLSVSMGYALYLICIFSFYQRSGNSRPEKRIIEKS